MPMMLVSSDEFAKELVSTKPDNIKVNESKVIDINRGRGNVNEINNDKRKEIATDALTSNLTGKELSIKHGVSESSISAYKNGATSTTTYNQPDSELNNHVSEVKYEITEAARNKLMVALNEITPERIKDAKIKDVASIAKDMSFIAKNMEPAGGNTLINNQVIVYRPKLRDEDEFDVITVNE